SEPGDGACEHHPIGRARDALVRVREPENEPERGGDRRERERTDQYIACLGFHLAGPPGCSPQCTTRARLPRKYALSHGCSDASIVAIGPDAMTLPSARAAMRSQTECRVSRSWV